MEDANLPVLKTGTSNYDHLWVVRYKPTGLWWRPNGMGYTSELLAAGVVDEPTAKLWATRRSPDQYGNYPDEALSLTEALKGIQEGTVFKVLLPATSTSTSVPRRSIGSLQSRSDGFRRVVRELRLRKEAEGQTIQCLECLALWKSGGEGVFHLDPHWQSCAICEGNKGKTLEELDFGKTPEEEPL